MDRAEQFLRQHARLADDGHEVRVAVPARHDVHVDVIEHAGAGRLAEVDPHVDAMRSVGLGQRDLGAARQLDQLAQLLVGRRRQRRHVAVRHDHQVAVVVGKQVEDDEAGRAAEHDERRPARR